MIVYDSVRSMDDLIPRLPRPCCHKLHAHGCYSRFCEDLQKFIEVKRLICSRCGATQSLLPVQLADYFKTSCRGVLDALRCRFATGRWPRSLPRQRGGNWLRRFSRVLLGRGMDENPVALLQMHFEESIWLFE